MLPLPAVTLVSAAGYLLETPDVSVRYSPLQICDGSDNPTVGDRSWITPENQQERLENRIRIGFIEFLRILRDHTPANSVFYRVEEMVRALRRRREIGRNDRSDRRVRSDRSVTSQSEIPCRVSSDLHEWRNDLGAVSTRDSAKLQYE